MSILFTTTGMNASVIVCGRLLCRKPLNGNVQTVERNVTLNLKILSVQIAE